MRIFGWGKDKSEDKHSEEMRRLQEAERRAQELAIRGERAAEAIHARLRRNHWGQTIEEIARQGGWSK